MKPWLEVVAAVVVVVAAIGFAWRWASRVWSLPCPSTIGWALEWPLFVRLSGTPRILERIGFRPGQRVLEIGPGPGRLLIPAAQRVLPGGEVVGIDIQPKMLLRLRHRAQQRNVTNLMALLGDATHLPVADASFDLVFLVTVLGEIPDRAAALAECYRVLRPGGVLSISEMFGDPHFQWKRTVRRLAAAAGFQLQSIAGGIGLYTANFVKP